MNFNKRTACIGLLFVLSMMLSGCAGQNVSGLLAYKGDTPPPVIMEAVDPVYFEQMAVLDQEGRWPELVDLSSHVLSYGTLDDEQKGWASYYAGRAFLFENNARISLGYAKQARSLLPGEEKTQILLGQAEFRFGNTMRGETLLLSLLSKKPDSLEVNMAIAEANEMAKHWQAALFWYEKVSAIKPNDPDIHSKIALMLWRDGYAEAAIEEFNKVLAINPEDSNAWNDKGIINLALGKQKTAFKNFNQALALDPANNEARLNRANYYAAEGKFDLGLADCETGLEYNPKDAMLLLTKGQIKREQGKFVEAFSCFESAYDFARYNSHVLNELSWFLATCPVETLRDGNRAVKLARQGVFLAETPDPGLYDTLAAAYAESGNYEEAVKIQESAIYLARQAGFSDSALRVWDKRLEYYRQGRAYHE